MVLKRRLLIENDALKLVNKRLTAQLLTIYAIIINGAGKISAPDMIEAIYRTFNEEPKEP